MKSKILNLITFVTATFVSTQSMAIITFDNVSGSNGSTYLGHTEDGFTVNNDGTWLNAQFFGNPTPDIFTNASSDTISLTETGSTGYFTFAGIDMACNNGTDCGFSIEGFLDSTSVLSLSGSVTAGPPYDFYTVATGWSSIVLDHLIITMEAGVGTTSMNIDNINVSATSVPEPSSLAILSLGLAGLGLSRRRKAA